MDWWYKWTRGNNGEGRGFECKSADEEEYRESGDRDESCGLPLYGDVIFITAKASVFEIYFYEEKVVLRVRDEA